MTNYSFPRRGSIVTKKIDDIEVSVKKSTEEPMLSKTDVAEAIFNGVNKNKLSAQIIAKHLEQLSYVQEN